MKGNQFYTILILLFFTLLGCNQKSLSDNNNQDVSIGYEDYINNFNNLPEDEGYKLLKKAIEYSGGWEKYTSINGLTYTKVVIKIDSVGAVIDSSVQHHNYNLFPEFGARMEYLADNDTLVIVNNGNQSWKTKNGIHQTDQQNVNSAYNSSFGSTYVLFMPWKLADPFTTIEYIGKQSLPNNNEGIGLKVTYSDKNSTTLDHTWWYYFEEQTGRPISNFLKYTNGYSYTEYKEFYDVEGLKINSKRYSYKSDSTMTDLKLSTIYKNTDIQIVPSHPKEIFELSQ